MASSGFQFGGGGPFTFGSASNTQGTTVPATQGITFGTTSLTGGPAGLFGGGASSGQPASGGFSFITPASTQPATNLFGCPMLAQQPGTNLFGSATSAQPSGTSIFGSTAATQSGTGMFGGTSVTQSGPSFFGGAPQSGVGGSLFGTSQQAAGFGSAAPVTQPASGIFGSTGATQLNPQTFSSTAPAQSMFGAPSTQSSSIFGAIQTTQQGTTGGTGMFGSAPQSNILFQSPAPATLAATTTPITFGIAPAPQPVGSTSGGLINTATTSQPTFGRATFLFVYYSYALELWRCILTDTIVIYLKIFSILDIENKHGLFDLQVASEEVSVVEAPQHLVPLVAPQAVEVVAFQLHPAVRTNIKI